MINIIQLVNNTEFVNKAYCSVFIKQFNDPNKGMLPDGYTSSINTRKQINTFRLTFIY